MNDGEIKERFYDCYEKIAEDDIKESIEKHKWRRHKLLKKFMTIKDNSTILDLGSGPCIFLDYLKEAPTSNIFAIDIAFTNLIECVKKGYCCIKAEGEQIPIKDSSCDIVVCSGVLEHVLDPDAVISEIKRVLGEEGILYLVVPWKEDISVYEDMKDKYEFTHLRSFDEENIRGYFSGFELKKISGVLFKEPKNNIGLLIFRIINRFLIHLKLTFMIPKFLFYNKNKTIFEPVCVMFELKK